MLESGAFTGRPTHLTCGQPPYQARPETSKTSKLPYVGALLVAEAQVMSSRSGTPRAGVSSGLPAWLSPRTPERSPRQLFRDRPLTPNRNQSLNR